MLRADNRCSNASKAMNSESAAFTGLVDLVSEALGGEVLGCSDEFFAEAENLVKPGRGVFIEGKYTERGKWMDGWESRRRRGGPDHDWCILKLGATGQIRALDIDTNHFLGNHPPYAAVDACHMRGDATLDELKDADWTEVLSQSALKAGSQNVFVASHDAVASHVRLRIYPDGGVARLRVYGDVRENWKVIEHHADTRAQLEDDEYDLAALHNGAMTLACSDMFFSPMQNLIKPAAATDMGDGWETRRKRHPGHDWIIVRLAARGRIRVPIVDTHFFKGNYPDRCSIDAIDNADASITELISSDAWMTLVKETKLEADRRHHLDGDLQYVGLATHVRVNMFPDGGLSRLRLYGTREED